MYLTLFHATEQAIDLLIAAQQACEEQYMQEDSWPVISLTNPKEPTEK